MKARTAYKLLKADDDGFSLKQKYMLIESNIVTAAARNMVLTEVTLVSNHASKLIDRLLKDGYNLIKYEDLKTVIIYWGNVSENKDKHGICKNSNFEELFDKTLSLILKGYSMNVAIPCTDEVLASSFNLLTTKINAANVVQTIGLGGNGELEVLLKHLSHFVNALIVFEGYELTVDDDNKIINVTKS